MDERKMSFHDFYKSVTVDFDTLQDIEECYDISLQGQKLSFITNISGRDVITCEYDFATGTGYFYL